MDTQGTPASHAEVHSLVGLAEKALAMDVGDNGRVSVPVISLPGLKVVVLAIKKNAKWAEHSTAGRITVQPLRGHIQIRAAGTLHDLPAGHLLALDSNVVHDVEALEDSAFLLTVSKAVSNP